MNKIASFLRVMAAALLALAAASCHSNRPVIPEEALQAPAHARFFTSSNIWYENPQAIPVPSVLKGKIIPFGTEISFISADQEGLKFKDVETGAVYSMEFDQKLMMMSMEDFIKKTFSTKSSDDISKDLRPSTYEKLKRGVVEEGMTRDMVLLAYGYPSPARTAALSADTWIYWDSTLKSRYVVFKGDKVISAFDFQ